ncbi:MAG TPA: bifunctional class I SAM-dependent methyltransferase/GNAT family N-acetyltransferase [Candidatus Angelobacter sp.]|nr:bifunctional class I SAM-dependent methyltransferase/GNAT family N-acetyltransferase [Candidatus Angelobacter sp.]
MSMALRTPIVSDQEQIELSLRRVCEAARSVATLNEDFSELHESIMELENLVFSVGADKVRVAAILDALPPEHIRAVQDAYGFWQASYDSDFIRRLLQEKTSVFDYPFSDRFADLVRRELALLPEAKPQRPLVIGGGAFPITAIHLHLQTNAPVDIVLRDANAVDLTQKVLEQSKLDGHIHVSREKEMGRFMGEYDLIVIEVPEKSKKAILREVRKRARPGCQILCRTAHGLRRLMFEPTAERDLRGFHVKREQAADGTGIFSTALLEAARSAATEVRLEWLREIDPFTAAQLIRLMNRTLEEETTIGFPGPIDDTTGHAVMQDLNAAVVAGRHHVLVAKIGETIVGQLILTPNASPNHRHIVELTRGTIDRSFRGGGLALRAFQEVARKCEELRREVICLDVRAGTMAAMWWQHFGFKPYGFLADYSRVGDKVYEGLYLTETTAELKLRLQELVSGAAADAALHLSQVP